MRSVEGVLGFFFHTPKRLRLRRTRDGQVGRLRWFWTTPVIRQEDEKKNACFTYVAEVSDDPLGKAQARGVRMYAYVGNGWRKCVNEMRVQ
jgi:hypothetical protein